MPCKGRRRSQNIAVSKHLYLILSTSSSRDQLCQLPRCTYFGAFDAEMSRLKYNERVSKQCDFSGQLSGLKF